MAAVLLLWQPWKQPEKAAGGSAPSAGVSPSPGSKIPRTGLAGTDPAVAMKRLRALLDAPLDGAPSFDQVDALARRLTDADLQALLREVGLGEHLGLIGWVRSGAGAEWARRDPEAVMAWLEAMQDEIHSKDYPLQQAWCALFRGWSETDPAVALAGFNRLQEAPSGTLVGGQGVRLEVGG
ncbi:MAG: hypothetical protein HKN82_12295 [Akkermansiaceae bacterium]|nr:hypothetical protein [Akkermansiaceae bacterium]NNM30412.1 hypothetical protein [Akkermansiaceae bacterium]